MPSGRVINTVKDAIAVMLSIFESTKLEIVFLTPPFLMSLAAKYASMQAIGYKKPGNLHKAQAFKLLHDLIDSAGRVFWHSTAGDNQFA